MATQYFIKIADNVTGPFISSQLKHMAGEGRIPKSARVSVDQKKWYCVENIKGLSVSANNEIAALKPDVSEAIEEESIVLQSADSNRSVQTRCDILISYRRKGGSEIARYVAEGLRQRGYSVFLDVDGLGSGNWSDELEHRVAECKDFIPIITEGFFERCKNTDDIVRKELAHAIANEKNIVPLIATEHPFPTSLPADIAKIPAYNGPRYVHEYAPKAVEKLCAMLTSRVGGPERLHAGDAQPRVVVAIVAMIFGAWQGSAMGLLAGDVGPLANVGLSDAIENGVLWGLVTTIGLGIPLLVALSFCVTKLEIRADRLYTGPWIPFWLLFIPSIFIVSSVVTNIVFSTLGIQSYFWGGVFGQLTGVGLVAFVVKTKVWNPVSKMISLVRS